jgi:hypothetical protein
MVILRHCACRTPVSHRRWPRSAHGNPQRRLPPPKGRPKSLDGANRGVALAVVRSLTPCLAAIRKPLTIPDPSVRIRVRCCVHAYGGRGLPRTGAGAAGAGRPHVKPGAAVVAVVAVVAVILAGAAGAAVAL